MVVDKVVVMDRVVVVDMMAVMDMVVDRGGEEEPYRLVDVLATVDDEAEELLHLGLHGDHAEADAHDALRRRALAQAEGGVGVPQGGHLRAGQCALAKVTSSSLIEEVRDCSAPTNSMFRWLTSARSCSAISTTFSVSGWTKSAGMYLTPPRPAQWAMSTCWGRR